MCFLISISADINECIEGTAGCNQNCTNTPGNYTCDCYHGYSISTVDHHICAGEFPICIEYPSLQKAVL
ncbi:MAG: hypothetical protein MPK62_12020 [Alphaproteobacteria bacterium]|nr:hypothetical protein [Alphaproteobacteria bacterium]